MHRSRGLVAVVLAALLVTLTPVLAFADAGPKSQGSIDDNMLLSQVESMMTPESFQQANHGGIVSLAAQRFQDLVSALGFGDTKPTRGQLISALARSGAGKGNKNHEAGIENSEHDADVADTGSTPADRGKGRSEVKPNQGKRGADSGDEEEDDDETASAQVEGAATATATSVPASATPTPTATTVPASVTPTSTATAVIDSATATPTPTEEEKSNRGQGHGNQGR